MATYKRCAQCGGRGIFRFPGTPGTTCPACDGFGRDGGPTVGDIMSTRQQYVLARHADGSDALYLERAGMRTYLCDHNSSVQVYSSDRVRPMQAEWLAATA